MTNNTHIAKHSTMNAAAMHSKDLCRLAKRMRQYLSLSHSIHSDKTIFQSRGSSNAHIVQIAFDFLLSLFLAAVGTGVGAYLRIWIFYSYIDRIASAKKNKKNIIKRTLSLRHLSHNMPFGKSEDKTLHRAPAFEIVGTRTAHIVI